MADDPIESVLPFVQKPSRYLGSEINSVRKDPSSVKLRIALAFPDLYDIGTSHFGLQILYHLLNREEQWAAERVFAPATDMERQLRDRNLPLLSLENRLPVRSFDIVGFSLLYELNFTNVINMIDLSGLPLTWRERNEGHPLVIAGGPSVCNPEPMADFFDAMVFGDGEKIIVEMARAWTIWRDSTSRDREALLRQWSLLEGVYVPRFYTARYDGKGDQYLVVSDGINKTVSRQIIGDLDGADFPDRPIIPFGKPIHDRLRLEVSRGCTRGCRFCQAGMIYRPVRERSAQTICSLVDKALRHTGYEDISLLSLSTGDYTCLTPLMETLMQRCGTERVAVSLPSLRAGSLTPGLMELIRSVRKTGFTIAPEAGSQRLRDVINKNIRYEDVADSVRQAFEMGWNVIKLYFMIGLPTETDADLDAIVDMVRKLKAIQGPKQGKSQINVSVTTFIPKAHTPFQWCRQISLEASKSKISYLRKKLRHPGVQVKWQHPEMSMIEGVLARGDRRLGRVIVEAWTNGALFDGWNDLFNFDAWKRAFQRCNIDPRWFTARDRKPEDRLPWQHMDSGVDSGFLRAEWQNATRGEHHDDCRHGNCHNCGVCDFESLQPVVFNACPLEPKVGESMDSDTYIWRALTYSKRGNARFFGHLELSSIFSRAIRRAGVSVKFSEGYHPMPKISFDDPLPLGMESAGERFRLLVSHRHQCKDVMTSINAQLPEGLQIIECMPQSDAKKRIASNHVTYVIDLKNIAVDEKAAETFLSSKSWPYSRTNKKGRVHRIDLRLAVNAIVFENGHTMVMDIRSDLKHTVRPSDILSGVFYLSEDQLKGTRILKQARCDRQSSVDNGGDSR